MATDPEAPSDFERAAAQAGGNLLQEFWAFLRYNKKWWLLPILTVLLLLGVLILLSGTAAAPFIYTLVYRNPLGRAERGLSRGALPSVFPRDGCPYQLGVSQLRCVRLRGLTLY